MSLHGTPHMSRNDSKLDSNSQVTDGQATNPKQLLNAYVYDFLIKSRLPQTAKIFVNEADIPSSDNGSLKNSPSTGSDSKNPGSSDLSKNSFNHPQSPSLIQFHKDNNLPISKMAMDAPQGFLFEWWQVFWDVYQAKNNKSSNPLAGQYYQLQMMKQRQQQEFQVSNNAPFNQFGLHVGGPGAAGTVGGPAGNAGPQPAGPIPAGGAHPMNGPQPNQPPQTAEQQAAQQRMMMQLMMNKQQAAAVAASQNPAFNQMDPQQQQRFLASMTGNGPNSNLSVQQQMLMMQQQQQQQQQPNGNKIQQHAQAQMNNLRQQAVAAQRQVDHQSPQPGGHPGKPGVQQPQHIPGGPAGRNPSQGPMPHPPQQQQQQGQIAANGKPGQTPNGQLANNGQFPGAGVYNAANGGEQQGVVNGMRMNSVNNGMKPGEPMANNHLNVNNPTNGNRNINALHDYQMQLMLLEKQNKKRLDIARNSGSGDPNALASLTAGMLPPSQQSQAQQSQQQQPPQSQQSQQPTPQQQTQPSPSSQQQNGSANSNVNPMQTPTNPNKPSPVIGNKPSPKKGKAGGAKRGRKPSVTAQNNSTTPSNSAATPAHLKKEFSTPLTPTSETPNDQGNGPTSNTSTGSTAANKRKRKNSNAVNESPKLPKNGRKDGPSTATIKEESEVKPEDAPSNVVPELSAISSNFHEMPQGDQMFTMDVLEGSGNQENLFGNSSANSNGLDDIDFDFNSFFDGNVNDGMQSFNWGGVDAVEDS